jgi:hypothetical protein
MFVFNFGKFEEYSIAPPDRTLNVVGITWAVYFYKLLSFFHLPLQTQLVLLEG